MSLLSLILYILSSLLFASRLNIRQSCITSTNENPLCWIAFVNVSVMCLMSLAEVLATNVAFDARASLIGLNGLSNVPSGEAFEVKLCCDVGVGCPVVREKDWLSWRIRVRLALCLNAWMKCAIPSAYIAPSPTKDKTFRFGFPSFIPIAVGKARP